MFINYNKRPRPAFLAVERPGKETSFTASVMQPCEICKCSRMIPSRGTETFSAMEPGGKGEGGMRIAREGEGD